MFTLARTPAALFRQMREEGRSLAEMETVRRAYDFGVQIYTGRFEIDGTPFVCHGLGAASVLSQLGLPAEVVGFGCVHNAYRSGEWGDARRPGPHPHRRERMRVAAGVEVESLAFDFFRHRSESRTRRVEELSELQRWFALSELADLLDKWDDGRIRYSVDGRGDRRSVEGHEDEIVERARHLGGDEFADSFAAAFARCAGEEIPESLKLGRLHSVLVPPASYHRRPAVVLKRRARALLGPARRRLRRAS